MTALAILAAVALAAAPLPLDAAPLPPDSRPPPPLVEGEATELPVIAPRFALEGRWAIEVCHLSAAAPLSARDPSPPVLLWSVPIR